MSKYFITICLISVFIVSVRARRFAFALDERWVCMVKQSCADCLRLPHCSWCETDKSCFSKKLPAFSDICANNTIDHEDYGLSLMENAQCACSSGEMKRHCYPPGQTVGAECSGRGTCVCGRCMCNSSPDPDYPTKMVIGEFCEFDNFSCDGPKCNEGPYSLAQPPPPTPEEVADFPEQKD